MDDELAQRWLRGTIRGEMKKRDISYADLAARLQAIGVDENERNLRNKLARGTYSAVFLCLVLEAIGVKNFRVDLVDFVETVGPGNTED